MNATIQNDVIEAKVASKVSTDAAKISADAAAKAAKAAFDQQVACAQDNVESFGDKVKAKAEQVKKAVNEKGADMRDKFDAKASDARNNLADALESAANRLRK